MSTTQDMQPQGSSPKNAPLSMVGRELDHFLVQEELGQGGMSVVYRARDNVLQRDVAIKVLHPFLADRVDARRRLAREARAVAKLRHNNILEVYAYSGEEAAQGYIAMELVRGETLKQFGDRERVQPCEVAAAICWVVAGALEHAHESGVIHRDVKPENVMIRQDGVLKLMDFGIAHVVDAAHLTITGTLQGSPAHMAPEVIEGQEVDARADLFSLGTVLFWLATGQLPFTAKTPHALLKKIVEGRYTEPQRLNPEISDRLAQVIKKSLAREPTERFSSAADFRNALREVWEEGGLEDPNVCLPLFFRHPDRYRTEWCDRAAERFVVQAEGHLKAKDRIKALGAVNRVLALRPEHPGAAALMKSIEQRSRVAGRWRVALGATALVTLVGAGVGITYLVNEQAAELPPPRPPQERATLPSTWVERVEAPARVAARPRPQVAKPAPKPERPIQRAPSTTIETDAPPPSRAAGPHVPVLIRVDPWGDLEVDGKPMGHGKKIYDLKLTPGPHKLRFQHTYAQTEEREVVVRSQGSNEISVQLHKAKPAYLAIVSPDDPDVFIDGVYKGTAKESERNPILVPLPRLAWRTPVTIALVQEGKDRVEFKRTVVAGERLDVNVTMREGSSMDEDEPRSVIPVDDAPTEEDPEADEVPILR